MKKKFERCLGCGNSDGRMCCAVPDKMLRENDVPCTAYISRDNCDYGVIAAARCEECTHWMESDAEWSYCEWHHKDKQRCEWCERFERRPR